MSSTETPGWVSTIQYMINVSDTEIDAFDTETLRQYVHSARILFKAAIFGEIDLTGIEVIHNNQHGALDAVATGLDNVKPDLGGDMSRDNRFPKLSSEQTHHQPLDLEAFDSIVGLAAVKEALINMLVLPRYLPYLFQGILTPPKRLLLYGLPGNGKSCLVRAAAQASHMNIITVSPSDIMSSWVGGSEQALKEVFNMAREEGDYLIFFDEIDAFMRKRTDREDETTRRLKCEMLHQLDNLESSGKHVVVVAATNRPFDLDEAVLRRFQQCLFVPPPDEDAKEKLFRSFLQSENCDLQQADFAVMVQNSSGFSCSDIRNICMNALMRPITELQKSKHFKVIYDDGKGPALVPCSAKDESAIRISLFKAAMPIHPRKVVLDDILAEMNSHRKSYTEEDVLQYKQWKA